MGNMVRDSSNFIKAAEAHRAKVKKMTPAQKQVYMKKRNEKSAAKRKVIQGDLVWPVNRVRRDMSKSFKKRPSHEAAIYMPLSLSTALQNCSRSRATKLRKIRRNVSVHEPSSRLSLAMSSSRSF